MSDECERLFSSCKILVEDSRSRLMMDIIEANECLRYSYGAPRKGTFDDEEAGEVEGEPQSPRLSPKEQATRRAQEEAAMTAEEREAGDIWQEGLDEEFAAIEGNTSTGEEGNTSDEDSSWFRPPFLSSPLSAKRQSRSCRWSEVQCNGG